MRAACLTLLLCVSYAAIADGAGPSVDPVVDGLDGTALTANFDKAINGREYLVKQVENEVTYTTKEFAVTGVPGYTDGDVYHGCFIGATEVGVPHAKLTVDKPNGAETCTVTAEQTPAGELQKVTYKVYTKKTGSDVVKDKGASQPSTLTVLELKGTKPERLIIVRDGCNVKFDILGIYSNPALTSVCGFYQNEEWVEGFYDSSNTEQDIWVPTPLPDDDKFNAWELKDTLPVSATDATKVVEAGCKFFLKDQAHVEFEHRQMISFDDNEKSCGANPLVAFEESYEGSEIKVTSLSQGKNCWTDATYSTSEMTCVGENKASKAFTVFCDEGKYKYFDGSADQPAAYKADNSQAKAFADETCGTAAILPVSLLVGALALLVSRA